jgi:hypothetical protein
MRRCFPRPAIALSIVALALAGCATTSTRGPERAARNEAVVIGEAAAREAIAREAA